MHVGGRDKLKIACRHRDLFSVHFASASEHRAAQTFLHNFKSMISHKEMTFILSPEPNVLCCSKYDLKIFFSFELKSNCNSYTLFYCFVQKQSFDFLKMILTVFLKKQDILKLFFLILLSLDLLGEVCVCVCV